MTVRKQAIARSFLDFFKVGGEQGEDVKVPIGASGKSPFKFMQVSKVQLYNKIVGSRFAASGAGSSRASGRAGVHCLPTRTNQGSAFRDKGRSICRRGGSSRFGKLILSPLEPA